MITKLDALKICLSEDTQKQGVKVHAIGKENSKTSNTKNGVWEYDAYGSVYHSPFQNENGDWVVKVYWSINNSQWLPTTEYQNINSFVSIHFTSVFESNDLCDVAEEIKNIEETENQIFEDAITHYREDEELFSIISLNTDLSKKMYKDYIFEIKSKFTIDVTNYEKYKGELFTIAKYCLASVGKKFVTG